MKTKKNRTEIQDAAFSNYTDQELAEAYVFPSNELQTAEENAAEDDFWGSRRKQFENRSEKQQMLSRLLQLKFQLEDYIGSNKYQKAFNFGYFLNEYVSRQDKKDKQFAIEVDITPTVLSQYINNHRKPKDEFVIRLEIHSGGMIPAINWFKVLQKDKEQDIITNQQLRQQESKHVKNRLEFAY